MGADELTVVDDLDGVADDRHLDGLALVLVAESIRPAGEADVAAAIDPPDDGFFDGGRARGWLELETRDREWSSMPVTTLGPEL